MKELLKFAAGAVAGATVTFIVMRLIETQEDSTNNKEVKVITKEVEVPVEVEKVVRDEADVKEIEKLQKKLNKRDSKIETLTNELEVKDYMAQVICKMVDSFDTEDPVSIIERSLDAIADMTDAKTEDELTELFNIATIANNEDRSKMMDLISDNIDAEDDYSDDNNEELSDVTIDMLADEDSDDTEEEDSFSSNGKIVIEGTRDDDIDESSHEGTSFERDETAEPGDISKTDNIDKHNTIQKGKSWNVSERQRVEDISANNTKQKEKELKVIKHFPDGGILYRYGKDQFKFNKKTVDLINTICDYMFGGGDNNESLSNNTGFSDRSDRKDSEISRSGNPLESVSEEASKEDKENKEERSLEEDVRIEQTSNDTTEYSNDSTDETVSSIESSYPYAKNIINDTYKEKYFYTLCNALDDVKDRHVPMFVYILNYIDSIEDNNTKYSMEIILDDINHELFHPSGRNVFNMIEDLWNITHKE